MKGTAPIPKHIFFPFKATHDQILALTGTRSAKDPNIIPPKVAKPRRWLGDDLGWED